MNGLAPRLSLAGWGGGPQQHQHVDAAGRPVSLQHWLPPQQQVVTPDQVMCFMEGPEDLPGMGVRHGYGEAQQAPGTQFSFSSSTTGMAHVHPFFQPQQQQDDRSATNGDLLELWQDLEPAGGGGAEAMMFGSVLETVPGEDDACEEDDALLRALNNVSGDPMDVHMSGPPGGVTLERPPPDTPHLHPPPPPAPPMGRTITVKLEPTGPSQPSRQLLQLQQVVQQHQQLQAGMYRLAPAPPPSGARVIVQHGAQLNHGPGMHSPNRSEASSSWCTEVRMIPPSDPAPPMLRVLSAPGLGYPSQSNAQRAMSGMTGDATPGGSFYSAGRQHSMYETASADLESIGPLHLHALSASTGAGGLPGARPPSPPMRRVSMEPATPRQASSVLPHSSPRLTNGVHVFSASSTVMPPPPHQTPAMAASLPPMTVPPVSTTLDNSSSDSVAHGGQTTCSLNGMVMQAITPHSAHAVSPTGGARTAPLQEVEVPPILLSNSARSRLSLMPLLGSRPTLPVPPDSPFSDDGAGMAPPASWSPQRVAAAESNTPFRSFANMPGAVLSACAAHSLPAPPPTTQQSSQPMSPVGSGAWPPRPPCPANLARHSTPAALEAVMGNTAAGLTTPGGPSSTSTSISNPTVVPRSPGIKRNASSDGTDDWAAMERVYGAAIKCCSGACGGLYDQPCDDHKCACCKAGRRVMAYEKQGFCGPCGRREVVGPLRFIRCGMCKAEMVERAYDAHLKQYVIMPDPVTGKKNPVKCKEHTATHPKMALSATHGRRCSKCNNMRPLSYYASEESTCNWHIAQRQAAGGGTPCGGRGRG